MIRNNLKNQDGKVEVFCYGEDVPTGNQQGSRNRGRLPRVRKDLLRNPPELQRILKKGKEKEDLSPE